MQLKYTKCGYAKKPSNFGAVTKTIQEAIPTEVSYKDLCKIIKKGNAYILAEFKEGTTGADINNISLLPALVVDVDNKEGKQAIKLTDFINLVLNDFNVKPRIAHYTFSDTDNTNFRVIYELEKPLTVEEYQKLYKGFICVYGSYIDTQTKNANRIWAGTDKNVFYNSNKDDVLSIDNIQKFISFAEEKESKEQQQIERITVKKHDIKDLSDYEGLYIKKDMHIELIQEVNRQIDIQRFLEDNFQVNFKRSGSSTIACCPFHAEKKPSFSIHKAFNRCKCFSCGEEGQIYDLAKKIYAGSFREIMIQLIENYGVNIDFNEYFQVKIKTKKAGGKK